MVRYSILIVEDSATQRNWLASYFRHYGFTNIVEAENGSVANKLTDDVIFDLIVCDLEMPVMDGIEFIRSLAAKKVVTPLIIASQRERNLISSVELMATISGVKVLGSLQKPFTTEEMDSLMDAFLRQQDEQEEDDIRLKPEYVDYNYVKSAIYMGRVMLHYQPKMRLQDGTIAGVEALVRLPGLAGGLVYPNEFINLCETTGLIDELTFSVIRTAFHQLSEWNDQGVDVPLSINLSAKSFNNETFCNDLIRLVKGSGELARRVIFEVTETAIISDFSNALSVLSQLRLLGCGLSIDDYGTGYSSIKLLTQIPFTELKLDRSLVDGIAHKSHLQVIYSSTRDMCAKLNLDLVCEGVECEEDRAYLAANQCEYAQGYLFSRPLDAKDVYFNFLAYSAVPELRRHS